MSKECHFAKRTWPVAESALAGPVHRVGCWAVSIWGFSGRRLCSLNTHAGASSACNNSGRIAMLRLNF